MLCIFFQPLFSEPPAIRSNYDSSAQAPSTAAPPLANVVMQISRDPAALLLLRCNQLPADPFERLLGKFLICRINRRTDEPTKRSIPVHSRRGNIEYPAVGSIAAAEAVTPLKTAGGFLAPLRRCPIHSSDHPVDVRGQCVAVSRLWIRARKGIRRSFRYVILPCASHIQTSEEWYRQAPGNVSSLSPSTASAFRLARSLPQQTQ